jgi:hypothetical protein
VVYQGGPVVYARASWRLVELVSQLTPSQWKRIIRQAARYSTVDIGDIVLDDNASDLVLEDGDEVDGNSSEASDHDSLFSEVEGILEVSSEDGVA